MPENTNPDNLNPNPNANTPAETFSREYVTELRSENKNIRTKAQAEVTAREAAEAKATQAEKDATDKITAAEKAANDRIIRAELKAAALKAGMIDLDGLKLADLSKVTLNADGEIEGADALMEEMKKAKAYLFTNGSSTSSTHQTPPKKDPEQKHATKMTDEEYAAEKKKHGFK